MSRTSIQSIFTQREVIHKLVTITDGLDETTRKMASDYDNMVAEIRKRTVKNQGATSLTYAGNPNKLALVSTVSSVGTINTFAELSKYAEDIIKRIKKTK